MRGLVNVVLAIDTALLLGSHENPSGDPEQPTPVEGASCFLIGSPGFVSHGQATHSLSLKNNPLPTVDEDGPANDARDRTSSRQAVARWRSLSVAGGTGQRAVIYRIRDLAHVDNLGYATAHRQAFPVPTPFTLQNTHPDLGNLPVTTTRDYFLDIPLPKKKCSFEISFYIAYRNKNHEIDVAGYFKLISRIDAYNLNAE